MNRALLSLCIILIVCLSGCKKTDLSATYIYLDENAFIVDVSNYNDEHNTAYDAYELESMGSQKFHNAWIYVDGQDLGTWELPCKIPILAKDSSEIMIYPSIKMNGQSVSRPRYPFVDPYKTRLERRPGQITQLSDLQVKYTSTASFEFIENFNTDYNGVFHPIDTSIAINFEHIADPDNPANRIGEIVLDGTDSSFELVSNDMDFNRVLPNYVFLEMDYRSDSDNGEVCIGMLIDKSTTSIAAYEPLVIANATKTWKKIYVNLTQSVARNQINATNYRVRLSGGRDDSPIHFYFDNIKVIYQ